MHTPPPDRLTLSRGELAALLAHHADVIAARWRTADGPGAWLAASTLDSHADELTADEETPAVRELLDSVMSFDAEQQPAAALSAPADAGLRDRIAEALMQWAEGNNDPKYAAYRRSATVTKNAYSRADAVLAVLPAPTARAAVLSAEERQFLTFALDLAFDRMVSDDGFTDADDAALAKLRRMADEAQQAAEPEVFSPEVVAYEHPTRPRAYLCRQHGDGTPGLTPLESDDLPDGGICDECGVDVLIPQGGTQRPDVVHGCPPDGSGLTPCCGRPPFELPLTDRISSEAPTTCPGVTEPAPGPS